MNSSAYLKRIDVSDPEPLTLANLAVLQTSHMLRVPFENLDIHWNKPIKLDTEALYQKIVENRRGGFCYELNGLFGWLLEELEYDIEMLSCRVYSSKTEEFGPEFDHMALLVHLDNESYIVDVGFGDSFRTPIKMPDGQSEDVSGRYRITEQDAGYLLQRKQDKDWEPQYTFSLISRKLEEFEAMCEYHQTSPDSHFTQQKIMSIATEWGRISLSEKALITTKGRTKVNEVIANKREWQDKLLEVFGIEAP